MEGGTGSLESRPGVLLVGAAGVGKRTLLSRLLSTEIPDMHDLSLGVLCQGWTIETKYYSADLSIWTAHLGEDFSLDSLPRLDQLAALVMVFDMNDESSFSTLRNWVASVDIQRFEILLCIGNKADLVPGHQAHAEYRRHMQKRGESRSDPHPEYFDFGIDESEGCSLLSDEEPSISIRSSSSQWCIEHNIEYIEACASNADFDKCLSVDGDSQGVERLFGALSAHMWPGMTLRSGNRVTTPSLVEKEESTDDEFAYEIEYEVLPEASDESWEFVGESSTVRNVDGLNEPEGTQDNTHKISNACADYTASRSLPNVRSVRTAEEKHETQSHTTQDKDPGNGNTTVGLMEKTEADSPEDHLVDSAEVAELHEDEHCGLDDLERLMSEIGNMRSNLRLMPDFQRREMAATLAMKMAAMFDDSDEEGFEPA